MRGVFHNWIVLQLQKIGPEMAPRQKPREPRRGNQKIQGDFRSL